MADSTPHSVHQGERFARTAGGHAPSVLLLDEATSHLDTDNERRVSATIRALRVTRIIVAHRPETIQSADRVIYLDGTGGRVPSDHSARRTVELAAVPHTAAVAQIASS